MYSLFLLLIHTLIGHVVQLNNFCQVLDQYYYFPTSFSLLFFTILPTITLNTIITPTTMSIILTTTTPTTTTPTTTIPTTGRPCGRGASFQAAIPAPTGRSQVERARSHANALPGRGEGRLRYAHLIQSELLA